MRLERENTSFFAPPYLCMAINLKMQNSRGQLLGNIGKPVNLILGVGAEKHKFYDLH